MTNHHLMKAKNKAGLAAIFFLLLGFSRADAQLSYSVTDLGTLGGNASTANGVASRGGSNAFGMIVGSSTMSDNSPHAFLYTENQMFDLNTLCDLSKSDFKVLTSATSISDSCLIIGEGLTNNGDKHAFLLTPLSVEGGQWSYNCCQWIWIQEGDGWWWEESCGCYKWHGPPGRHGPCPPQPPPCWWYPLPCPPHCRRPRPTPTPPNQTPTPTPSRGRPTPTPPNETPTPTLPPGIRRTPTPPPTFTGVPLGVMPTPTPHRSVSHGHTRVTPTPSGNFNSHTESTGTRRGKGKSTPKPTPEIPR